MTEAAASTSADAAAALLAAMRRPGASFESTIAGASMAPTIPDRARIRITTTSDGIGVGDTLACLSRTGTLFAHRAVHRLRRRGVDWVLTVGDGWILCDSPTPASRIVGVVREFDAGQGWTPTAGPARRGWLAGCVSRASVLFVASMLRVHPLLAQHLAGGCLHVGARLKTLRLHLAPR